MEEIETMLRNLHDLDSIVSLRSVIGQHEERLNKMINKIEKVAAGESMEDSLLLSDLTDLSDDD